MKFRVIIGCCTCVVCFAILKICTWFSGVAKVWVQIWDVREVFIGKDFNKLEKQFSDKFLWVDLDAF